MNIRNLARVIGLRSATPEEIEELVQRWSRRGYVVEHVTKTKSGIKLSFNGILKLYKRKA